MSIFSFTRDVVELLGDIFFAIEETNLLLNDLLDELQKQPTELKINFSQPQEK